MAVKHQHGRAVWQPIEFPILTGSLSTGTYVLSRHQAADWMQQAPSVSGACLYYMGGPAVASTSALSTGCIHAIVTVERTHPTAPAEDRVRYDDYLIVRLTDGQQFQVGPDKRVTGRHHPELQHHSDQRSGWLADLYARSTSTGW